MATSGYERLEVYQRSMALLPRVNELIQKLPGMERYELASQLRRARRSVPTDIAEGYAKRKSAKEFCNYLTIAMGSANEVEVHLKIAAQTGYGTEFVELAPEYNVLGRQLNRLIASWRDAQQPATSN